MTIQRGGYTETHTNRAVLRAVSRPGAAGALLKFNEGSHSSQKSVLFLTFEIVLSGNKLFFIFF